MRRAGHCGAPALRQRIKAAGRPAACPAGRENRDLHSGSEASQSGVEVTRRPQHPPTVLMGAGGPATREPPALERPQERRVDGAESVCPEGRLPPRDRVQF